jgi:hypothetical protein
MSQGLSRSLINVKDNITPDDKNWTWVLERKCDECGFDASVFDSTRTANALRDQVVCWSSVLTGDDVMTRPQLGVWSPLEYGCHVRDVFRKFDERLKLMLETTDPAFENWDQDATAVVDRYDLQNPEVVSVELREAGLALAARFELVQPDQWSRRGFRSDGSVFTVDSIAKYLLHDPVHHLWDVGAEVPIF